MAVTTTPPTKRQLKDLKQAFRQYQFAAGEVFSWAPDQNTIFHPKVSTEADVANLLHEIAHAELGHNTYGLDIELIKHEVAAWQHAAEVLAPQFNLSIDQDLIEDSLDTYRRWLHDRSSCPNCGHNGLQTTQNTYNCSNCRCSWRVNEARNCALRRVKTSKA